MKQKSRYSNNLIGYGIALVAGLFVGYRTSPQFTAVPYLIVSVTCVYFALRNNSRIVLTLLPYIIYTEIFMRAYVHSIPYLFAQYFIIAVFGLLLVRRTGKVKMYSRCYVFLLFFSLVELINIGRSDAPDIARAIFVNDLATALIVTWGCVNVIEPVIANKILNNVKYAGVYLCAVVMARYLIGDVEFSNYSATEGTNGLAPVQLSGYLGFSCFVFFLSIMAEQERKSRILNIVLFALNTVIMLLSFSRGGLYFLGIMMFVYLLMNRSKVKSYFLFLMLVPVGFIIYNYVTEKTNGMIVQRYEQNGSSGRNLLIMAGWTLFKSQPLAGIGTGNFNSVVAKMGLYGVSSGAHNEFIRVAAEDGVLGFITYGLFYIILFYEILRRDKIAREYAIYFLIFFCLICVHNALKISLQPLILLLAVGTHSTYAVKKKRHVLPESNIGFRLEEG